MIYFILGQTATGKTARAVRLAREYDGELINCDSRQLYKELDIITGKNDNPQDTHMVNLIPVTTRFSAHDYAVAARIHIANLLSQNKTPIVVGGAGLYARYLLYMNNIQHEPDRAPFPTGLPNSDLIRMIDAIDPQARAQLNDSDRQNPRRLESLLHRLRHPAPPPLSTHETLRVSLSLHCDIQTVLLFHRTNTLMRARITTRVYERMDQGAIEECRSLLSRGYSFDAPGLRTIGYTSLFSFLRGECTQEYAVQEWITAEYRYAKRQSTYFLKYFPHAIRQYV